MSATLIMAGQRLTAAVLNANSPGPWIPITPLNSWVNSGGALQALQVRQLNSTTLHVTGSIKSGVITNGTNICILPTSVPYPVNGMNATCQITGGTGTGGTCTLFYQSNGAIALEATTTGMTQLSLDFLIALDAS